MNAASALPARKITIKIVAAAAVLGVAALLLFPLWGLPLLIKYYTLLHGAVLVRPH